MILIVDDNEDSLRIVTRILTSNGYEVAVARNGRDGVESALETVPELIILDIMMPEMNGLEALEELRKHAATSAVPVILLTAKSHDEDVIEGYRVGADYYMTKPFSAKQLLYGVRLVLGQPQSQ
jgi:DNA-binding response OmpR family regulator